MDVSKGFVLRSIQPTDNTRKFSLGDEALAPLKTFLVKHAWNFHEHQIAKTYVLVQEGFARIWAYITLVSSEALLESSQRPENPIGVSRYNTFPAVKIARLAVDKEMQGQGLGKVLVEWAMSQIREAIMPIIGCRFVVVDSKPNSIRFYERIGFVLVDGQSEIYDNNPKMFFDLAKVGITSALADNKIGDLIKTSDLEMAELI